MLLLLKIHGEFRWLIAIVGLVAILRFASGWLRGSEYKPLDRGLMSALTGLLDLNLLLGLVLLFGLGVYSGGQLEHATTMLIAIVAVHTSAAWRRSDDARLKFRNNLIVILAAFVLVLVGVLRLRGGWLF